MALPPSNGGSVGNPNDRGAPNGPKLTPGAVLKQVPKFLIDQAMGALKGLTTTQPSRQPPVQADPMSIPALPDPNAPSPRAQYEMQQLRGNMPRNRREPWFGPGTPLSAQAPRGDVAGRARDYPVGINLGTVPRQYEAMNFHMLRGLFDGLDLAKLCVETRKNQMAKLSWQIMPRMKAGQNVRVKDDPRCAQLEAFFRSPDRIHNWDTWMRMLLHEMMVTDAPSIYIRRTLGGDVYSLEVIDGADVLPRIDQYGRTPAAPDAAYSHILKGVPAINYTTDELIYFPRNLRAGRVYGQSPIELIGLTIQIAIRRDVTKLQFYTEGNIPDALIGTPADWTPDQIARMQQMFDNWTSDPANRRKVYFIPGGTSYNATRPAQTLDPQQDEWLARLITYAFNLPNLPLVNQQNRATSETANDAALREGLAPTIVWLKGLMDHIIGKVFGFPDIEWIMDNYQEEAPDALSARQLNEVRLGALSLDEYRAERGQEAVGMKHAIWGLGPMGIMFVDDLVKMHEQGLLIPPAPPAPDAGAGAASPFDPASGGAPKLSGNIGQLGSLSASGAGPGIPGMTPMPQPGERLALPAPVAARLKAKPPISEIGNRQMAEIPGHMLDAVGLKPNHTAIANPVTKKPKGRTSMIVSLLQHHEAKYKGQQDARH